jgi:hypothetical protein
MNFEEQSFGSFKNYSFDKEAPALPVKQGIVREETFARGRFNTVFLTKPLIIDSEEPKDCIIKISKFIEYVPGNPVPPELIEQDFLVEKDSTESPITALERLIKYKEQIRSKSSQYMAPHLCEFYGASIISSPRRTLEKLARADYPDIEDIDFSDAPTSEIATLELWERADGNELVEMDFERLQALYNDENFQQAFSEFSSNALRTFLKHGYIYDIFTVNSNVALKTKSQTLVKHVTPSDLYAINPSKVLIAPRNISYDSNPPKVTLFDLFPVDDTSVSLVKFTCAKEYSALLDIITYATDEDKPSLISDLITSMSSPFDRITLEYIANYLVSLDVSGADFSQVLSEFEGES